MKQVTGIRLRHILGGMLVQAADAGFPRREAQQLAHTLADFTGRFAWAFDIPLDEILEFVRRAAMACERADDGLAGFRASDDVDGFAKEANRWEDAELGGIMEEVLAGGVDRIEITRGGERGLFMCVQRDGCHGHAQIVDNEVTVAAVGQAMGLALDRLDEVAPAPEAPIPNEELN